MVLDCKRERERERLKGGSEETVRDTVRENRVKGNEAWMMGRDNEMLILTWMETTGKTRLRQSKGGRRGA